MGSYKLVSATIENCLRVKFAHIDFTDGIVGIGGENGHGKSSVAKAIWMALGGKREVPEIPVLRGEKEGRVVLDLDPDLVLTAVVKPDREIKLELKSKDGSKISNAGEVLRTFNARYGFFPHEFITASPKDRLAQLRSALGIDTTKLDSERLETYNKRTDINRELKAEVARLEAAPIYDNLPAQEIPVSALLDELKTAQAAIKAHEANILSVTEGRGIVNEQRAKAAENRATAAKLLAEAEELEAKAIANTVAINAAEDQLSRVNLPQLSEIEHRIKTVDNQNRMIREQQQRDMLLRHVEQLTVNSEKLTSRLADIDRQKLDLIASANIPVLGLNLSDDDVTLNGLPFAQASDAEQWRAAIAIGFAMNPKLKLVYVKHGSLLTPKSREMVYEITKQCGGQLLFEIAGDAADVTVTMEDGVSKEK